MANQVRLLTPREATAFVNALLPRGAQPISATAVYAAVANGELLAKRIGSKGGRIILTEENVVAWISGHSVPGDSTHRPISIAKVES